MAPTVDSKLTLIPLLNCWSKVQQISFKFHIPFNPSLTFIIMPFQYWHVNYCQTSITSLSVTRPKQVLGLGLKSQESEDSSDPGLCICCRPTSRRTQFPGPSSLPMSEQDGGQHMIRNEISATVYNYSLFHLTMCLANMYITMQLTQWFQPQVVSTLSIELNHPIKTFPNRNSPSNWRCLG